MKLRILTAALLGALLSSVPAQAQEAETPLFRGPAVHDGAWQNRHTWDEAFEGDPGQGSYAYAYRVFAKDQADAWTDEGIKLDCADLSIALLCEFAAKHQLPLKWRVYYPAERRFVSFDNENRQFDSPASFRAWSQYYLGAMNLADNTYPVSYDDWAGGDMVLMDWNQTEEWPNFGGREVWHTYLIGLPGELVYYGNEDDSGGPTAVSRVTSGYRLGMVKSHPDRYGLSPRRFRLFQGKVWGPARDVAEVIRARRLNLRAGPGLGNAVLDVADRGATAELIGQRGRWANLRLADGREVWAHMGYLEIRREPIPAEEPAAVAEAQPEPTPITGAPVTAIVGAGAAGVVEAFPED